MAKPKDRKPSRRNIPRAELAAHWDKLLTNPAWKEILEPRILEEMAKRKAPLLDVVDLEDVNSRKRLYDQGGFHTLRDLVRWIRKEADIAENIAFLGGDEEDLVGDNIRENQGKRGAS